MDALDWARASSDEQYDLCVTTLFLHHFQSPALEQLLGAVAARCRAFVACEPRRNSVAWLGSHLLGLLGANEVTREDGVTSVVAGFAGHELSALWPPSGARWRLREYFAWPFTHCLVADGRSEQPMHTDTDALVIGAGPAGASAAIRLASFGWRVTLLEQTLFPRQKVCGECLGPASLELLDELGLGSKVSELAGPAIRQVAWMAGDRTIVAEMPACPGGRHAYGCAIGRDCLDMLLLEHARSQGVDIVQPAKVRACFRSRRATSIVSMNGDVTAAS